MNSTFQLLLGLTNLWWSFLFTSEANEFVIEPYPCATITNPCPYYTFINSVDFHPKENLLCATYTHGQRIVFYKIGSEGKVTVAQTLMNPAARLRSPQHAVFHPNGNSLLVANWHEQTMMVYERTKNGLFTERPTIIFSLPNLLHNHRPHGIAFSPDGSLLAVAYGATKEYGKAIALFAEEKGTKSYRLVRLLNEDEIPAIPKGITFSPDGQCLLVTFCDINSVILFALHREGEEIFLFPQQTVQGEESRLARPEDIKIFPDGNYCAVSNSGEDHITLYPFDHSSNMITQNAPAFILENPEATLFFPHGIAFSSDGSLLSISQFGQIRLSEEGVLTWKGEASPTQAKIHLYKLGFHKNQM